MMNPDTKLAFKVAIFSAIFTLLAFMLANYFINRSWNLFSDASKSQSQPFTAQGSASVKVTPDQAQVSFSVNKTATTLQDAQNQANTATNAIVNDLEKIGIDKNNIQTGSYNSYPNYSDDSMVPQAKNSTGAVVMPIRPNQPSQTIISYTVNESVSITINDISKANGVIDVVTKDGAENIYGPNLTLSDSAQKTATDQVRTQAINDAKEKAQQIASAAGIKLGKVINVQEDSTPYPIPVMMKADAQTGSGNSSAPTQINPGENTITETVTLSFETQ
jgi:uncharacterized protein YggE